LGKPKVVLKDKPKVVKDKPVDLVLRDKPKVVLKDKPKVVLLVLKDKPVVLTLKDNKMMFQYPKLPETFW
jgi:hypothetical protein